MTTIHTWVLLIGFPFVVGAFFLLGMFIGALIERKVEDEDDELLLLLPPAIR